MLVWQLMELTLVVLMLAVRLGNRVGMSTYATEKLFTYPCPCDTNISRDLNGLHP